MIPVCIHVHHRMPIQQQFVFTFSMVSVSACNFFLHFFVFLDKCFRFSCENGMMTICVVVQFSSFFFREQKKVSTNNGKIFYFEMNNIHSKTYFLCVLVLFFAFLFSLPFSQKSTLTYTYLQTKIFISNEICVLPFNVFVSVEHPAAMHHGTSNVLRTPSTTVFLFLLFLSTIFVSTIRWK